MLDWLKAPGDAAELAWTLLALRLSAAMVFGLIVAAVFAVTQRRPAGQAMPLITTLVLLTMLVAMTTIVIGDSVARAFGLVGALSIVRFRTVVEDTRDTSFVIFAVVVGMAIGAGHMAVCLVGVPLVALAAFGLGQVGNAVAHSADRRLEIRIGVGREPEALFAGVFAEQLNRHKLVSATSARQGAAIDLHYRVKLKNPTAILALVKAMQAIEGVQNVQLTEE